VITPSRPTFSIASPMILPTRGSLFAEIVPTWRTSVVPRTGRAILSSCLMIAARPSLSAALIRAGAAPDVIARSPWLKIASVSSVAVVVPSPATSLVLLATSLTSWAPMCS
jgi:hypothetical protein